MSGVIIKTSTKAGQAVVHTSSVYTSLPYAMQIEAAQEIQNERPWSNLSYQIVRNLVYEQTANGCLDVYVYDSNGAVIAWAIMGETTDIHVGDMLVYMFTYVRKEHRNAGVGSLLIKTLRDTAKTLGLDWCGYSHWLKPKSLQFRYIDLRG